MSIKFVATNPFGDPTLDTFVWKGNTAFVNHLPQDPLLSVFITPSYQNTAVELLYAHDNHGREQDITVWLTFAPNGRWIEDITVHKGRIDDILTGGAAIVSSEEFAWEGAARGLKHFEPPHLPPVNQILAEGHWASHHATHSSEFWHI